MKVLIVDDSDAMRSILARALRRQRWNLTVIEARDGKQAIAKLKTEAPDLIITDWEMPTVSGIQLIEAFKRNGLKVPIGMITGHANPENRKRALESGAAFVIAKPFTTQDIKECLRPFLDPSAPLRQNGALSPASGSIYRNVERFLTEMVPTSVSVERGEGCPPTGSAGAIFVFGRYDDEPSHLMLVDWELVNFLDAAFRNLSAGIASSNIRQLRATPALQQTALEIGNVFRSFIRDLEGLPSLTVLAHALRGDGSLREPYWVQMLGSNSISTAKHTGMQVNIGSFGSGGLSLYTVRTDA